MSVLTTAKLPPAMPAPPTTDSGARIGRASDYRPLLQALPICAVILAGMAFDNGPLTMIGAVVAFAAAVASPPVGLAVLAVMTALRSPLVIPAPGFNSLLVGATLLGCVYRLPIDRPTLRPSLPLMLLLAFTMYITAQQVPELLAGYPGPVSHHHGYLFIQFATLAGVAVVSGLVLAGRSPRPFIAAGLIGALIAAVLAIAEPLVTSGPLENLLAPSELMSRVVGPFGDPNYFGLFLATAIAACMAMFVIARSPKVRLLLTAITIVLGIAFAITFSRGGLLALGAGTVALAFGRSRRAGFAAVCAVAVLALVVYPLFLEWRLVADVGRLSAQAYLALERSDASRIAAALAGPQMFLTSPILGIGWGQYSLLSGRYLGYSIESHNWYANVLAEQGLVGVFLWFPMLAAVALQLDRLPHFARSIGIAVFITYAVGSAFLQPPLSVQTSAFAVIVVVAALSADWSRFAPAALPEALLRPGRSGQIPP